MARTRALLSVSHVNGNPSTIAHSHCLLLKALSGSWCCAVLDRTDLTLKCVSQRSSWVGKVAATVMKFHDRGGWRQDIIEHLIKVKQTNFQARRLAVIERRRQRQQRTQNSVVSRRRRHKHKLVVGGMRARRAVANKKAGKHQEAHKSDRDLAMSDDGDADDESSQPASQERRRTQRTRRSRKEIEELYRQEQASGGSGQLTTKCAGCARIYLKSSLSLHRRSCSGKPATSQPKKPTLRKRRKLV